MLKQASFILLKSLLLIQLAFFMSCTDNPQTKRTANWLVKAQKLEAKNEIKLLNDLIETKLQEDSSNTNALLYYSKLKIYFGDYQSAFYFINKALREDRYLEEAYFQKGMIYKFNKDTSLAISSYYTVTEIDPENEKAWMEIALLYLYQNNSKALTHLNRALEAGYDSSEVIYAEGWYYQRNQDWQTAEKKYIKGAELKESIPENYYNLGFVQAKQNKLEEAINTLNKGKYHFPNYAKYDTLIKELNQIIQP